MSLSCTYIYIYIYIYVFILFDIRHISLLISLYKYIIPFSKNKLHQKSTEIL